MNHRRPAPLPLAIAIAIAALAAVPRARPAQAQPASQPAPAPPSGSRPSPPPGAPASLPNPAADPLVSPEVHPDRRITLRLRAPRAAEVAVAGEWSRPGAPPNTPEKLTRDANGVWSITVGPVEPNIYIYVFQVDGLTIVDPLNPLIKLRARTSASMVEVPGGAPWDLRDVPHGRLELHTHTARSLDGVSRPLVVYTPPGHDPTRGPRLPVLYLLHGNNDLAVGWTMAGRAHLALDNLLADKQVAPMLVVMPWGHALPFGSRPAPGQPTNNDRFADYLMRDVIPFVEARYRLAPGRRNRAIVGLSMGGAQALQVALAHPDRFGTLGIFGAGFTRADFQARFGGAAVLTASGRGTGSVPRLAPDLLYVGVGKEDGVRARAAELAEALRGHGLDPIFAEVDGGHTYPVWRKLFADLAPRLFRPNPAGARAAHR